MDVAYNLCTNIYNKKSISINEKLRHYNTVIRPEVLYAAETLTIKRATLERKLEIKKRTFLRKILGPRITNGES